MTQVIHRLSVLCAVYSLASLLFVQPLFAEKEECIRGEYILSRSTIEAKNHKALKEAALAATRPIQLAEQGGSAYLIEEGLDASDGADGEDGIVSGESARLCDRIRSRLRGLRAAEAGIVRRVECSCNAVIRASAVPNDPNFASQWGFHQSNGIDINMPEAWELATGSRESTVVAVIDTGVDYTHPDLRDNMWRNENEIPNNGIDEDQNGYIDDVYGINAIDNTGNPYDDNGHGTHVAGIIGAVGNNNQGVVGVNWSVRIVAVKFLGAGGYGSLFDAMKGVDYVTQLRRTGVPVVLSNNSWGGGGYYSCLADAIARAGSEGVLFVAAAGNESSDIDSNPSYPAAYPHANIISVASITAGGSLSYFSNYGMLTVDIAAPGSSIASTYPSNQYRYLSGTSMAAPHVSGALALLHSRSPHLNWDQLRDITYSSGIPLAALNGLVGTGKMLNVLGMLQASGAIPPDPTPTPTPVPRVLLLHSVEVQGDNVTVAYSKTFDACAHFWRIADTAGTWRKMAHQNFLCQKGEVVETVNMALAFAEPLRQGDVVKLCDDSEASVCSSSISVNVLPTPTPTPTPTPAYYTVYGRTADQQGRGVAGVKVQLTTANTTLIASSGADGSFRFTDVLGPIAFSLSAVKGGYSFQEQTGYLDGNIEKTLAGEQLGFVIKGVVLDENQHPIAGAVVNAGTLGTVITDGAGGFRFEAAYGAVYSLYFSAPNRHFERNPIGGTIYGDVERVAVGGPD